MHTRANVPRPSPLALPCLQILSELRPQPLQRPAPAPTKDGADKAAKKGKGAKGGAAASSTNQGPGGRVGATPEVDPLELLPGLTLQELLGLWAKQSEGRAQDMIGRLVKVGGWDQWLERLVSG